MPVLPPWLSSLLCTAVRVEGAAGEPPALGTDASRLWPHSYSCLPKQGNKFQLCLSVGGTNVPLCIESCLAYFAESTLEDVRWLCFFILFCNIGLIAGVAVVGVELREVNLT